jgi:hypothetical protein
MAIARGFAATAIFASIAVSAASTAWADPPTMSGHYIETRTTVNGKSITNDWNVTPCGDGCATVVSNGAALGQARLVNGQWTMDGTAYLRCADGTSVPNALSNHYTWDPNTLAGTIQQTYNVPACGQPAGFSETNTMQIRQAP